MLGYTTEEMVEKTFQEITHPDDLALDLHLLKELVQGKRVAPYGETIFQKNNQTVYIILGQ
jgi:hypothetical protein